MSREAPTHIIEHPLQLVILRLLPAFILTRSAEHPHGIKVRLETGEVGRVKEVVGEA